MATVFKRPPRFTRPPEKPSEETSAEREATIAERKKTFTKRYGKPESEFASVSSKVPLWYKVQDSARNVYHAAVANRFKGLIDQAWGALVSPRVNDTVARGLGFESGRDYNEHHTKVYKERLLNGINGWEKTTGTTLGSALSIGADVVATGGLSAKAIPAQGMARILALGTEAGVYGAGYEALRQASDEGIINSPEEVLFWGGVSAIGGPVLDKTLRVGSRIFSRAGGEATLKTIEDRTQQAIKNGKSPQAAYDEALARSGFTAEEIASTVNDTGRSTHWQQAVSDKAVRQVPSSVFGRAWDGTTSTLSKSKQAIEKVLTPISGRLRYMAPALLNQMRRNVLESNLYRQGLLDRYGSIAEVAKQLPRKERARFWDALNNSRRFEVDEVVSKLGPKAKETVDDIRNMWNDLLKVENAHGINTRFIEDYWPHGLKHGKYEQLTKHLGYEGKNEWQQLVKQATENNGGKELSQGQIEDLLLMYLQGKTPRGLRAPLLTRKRQIDFVTDDLKPYYEDPYTMGLRRIERHVHAISKRKFFGKHMNTDNIDDMGGEAVPMYVLDLLNRGEIYAKDMPQIARMIEAFVGYSPSSRGVQGAKNIFYASKIGQVGSAVTQLGDIGVAAYVNGLVNTLAGTFRSTTSRGVDPFRAFGLQHLAEEFASTGATAKMLDVSLKGSLFQAVDRMGKTVHVNAALTRNSRLVKSSGGLRKFREKWTPFFGQETDDLIRDLKSGEMTDNVRLLLWNELSDVQPVSLLEVPETYLRAKNGRVFYALKTFALKQLDILRRDALREIAHGNVGKGLWNMTRYTFWVSGANMTADQIKNFMHGREVDFTDWQFSYMLKQLMVSEYFVDQLTKGHGEAEAIVNHVMSSPIGMLESGFSAWHDLGKITEGTWSMRTSETLKDVPILGRMLYNLFGEGKARYNRKLEREYLRGQGLTEEAINQYENEAYGNDY